MKRSRLIIVLAALCLLGAATAEQKPAGSPAPAAQPALPSKVAVIPITGDIDYGLQKSLERRLNSALEQGAGVIIFEMDSYGGGLDPGAEMADMILAAGSKARTVAYVDKKAISADALISLACQQIIMRRGTTIGDCEAIMITQSQTMEVAPEKVQTFVRVLMRKYSRANGYPTALCEKMVDPEMEALPVQVLQRRGPLPLRPRAGRTQGRREAGDGDEADRRQGPVADHDRRRGARLRHLARERLQPGRRHRARRRARRAADRLRSGLVRGDGPLPQQHRRLQPADDHRHHRGLHLLQDARLRRARARRDRLLRHPVPEQVHGRPRHGGGHPDVHRGTRPDRRRDLHLAGTRRPGASRGHLHHRVARAGVPELLHPEDTTGSSASSSTT